MNDVIQFDAGTGEVLPPATGLYAAVAAQMDKSLTTARAFPRSLKGVAQAMSLIVTADDKTAESCVYSLKRGDRTIQGPSARFAEALAYAYGHLRVDARLVEEGRDYIVVRGEAHDLERNVIFAQDVTRRIVDSRGKRFDVDLISVTYMAAASIAQRDCLLKVIPSHVWRPAFEAVLQRITGDVKTLADRRVKAIGQFSVLGITAEQVFRKLGVKTIHEVTGDHLVELIGTFQAIKAGDASVDSEFSSSRPGVPSSGASPLAAPEDNGEPEPVAEAPAAPEPMQDHPLYPMPKGTVFSATSRGRNGAAALLDPSAPMKTWGPFNSFDAAFAAYEKDLRAATDMRSLRRATLNWGGRAYWALDEEQARRADDVYEAQKAVIEAWEKEAYAVKAKASYDDMATTDMDAATEFYEDAPDEKVGTAVEPEPAKHPHGLSLKSFENHRPRNEATIPVWEEIVGRLLEARKPDDPLAISDACAKEGLIAKLDQDDQNDLRAIRFRIKQALKGK